MPAFKITMQMTLDNTEDSTVNAAYYVNEDDFVTFKDDDHKQVATFRAERVISVTRAQNTTSIGTVYVNVVPKIDEKAMRDLLRECDRKLLVSRGASDGTANR